MSKSKGLLSRDFRLFLFVVVFAAVIYLVVRNIGVFGNILLVMVGFGAVVLVHEFGHFIVAKLAGIKVEAFSIFAPPILLGVRKTEDGFRFRILPKFFPKANDESGDGLLSFSIGRWGPGRSKPGKPDAPPAAGTSNGADETEYRIGLIPFGGFVKMLGQEDIGQIKASDDPRSFANKPVGARMAVIAAGVFFNAISAIIVFMIVFLIGIKLAPAVVGAVVPDSPASRAGLKPGDEVIEIAGKSDNLDFSNIMIAAALSDVNEAVALRVRHEDGSIEDFAIVAEQVPGEQLRLFGIGMPQSLTIAKVSEPNALLATTGLLPGDRIKAVNGKDVESHWQLEKIIQNTVAPVAAVLAQRQDELIESRIRLDLRFANSYEITSESELYHIYSMVPRLRITTVSDRPISLKDKLLSILSKIGIGERIVDTGPGLQAEDIILAIGEVENPTYKEMRDVTTRYKDRELSIKVLRVDANGVKETLTFTVIPKCPPGRDRVVIGVGVVLDAGHAVVAKTIAAEDGPERLAIPRGAAITAVDGEEVSNFYDVIREINRYPGQPFDSAQDRRITLNWRIDEEIAGDVALNVGADRDFVTVKSTFAEFVPFERLERLYKASGPIDAIVMGYRKTIMFIAQTYVTLRRWIGGLISPSNFMGPVGIIAFSYAVVTQQPLIYYVYLLGLISACIAVINFLPLPPFDGGLVVLLLVEKVKGSALSERTQEVIIYAGWALVGTFILYITFNDILRIFSP